MRLKVSSGFGSAFLPSVLGLVGLAVVSGCGGDEPVANPGTNTNSNDDTSAETSGPDDTSAGGNTTTQPANPTTTSTATTDSTPPEVPAGMVVGIGCSEDTDCEGPLKCVRTDDSFRGALPGTGICTMPCTSDAQCQELDAYGFCDLIGSPTPEALAATADGEIPEGMAPFCLQACPFGLSTTKCDSLATYACTPISADVTDNGDGTAYQLGLCLPLCSGDDDCASGEHCDPQWGLCVEEETPGKGIGEKCDPSAEVSECAGGACLGISEELPYGMCTTACNIHPDTIVCGGEPGPNAEFGCFSSLFTELLSTLNDFGQCLVLCDADEDCPDAFACDLREAESFEPVYGRGGVCFPTDASIAAAVEALGGVDAGSAPGDTTTPAPEANPDAGSADGG